MNDIDSQDLPTESRLSQILAHTSEQMMSEFKKRISFDLNGTAGKAGRLLLRNSFAANCHSLLESAPDKFLTSQDK